MCWQAQEYTFQPALEARQPATPLRKPLADKVRAARAMAQAWKAQYA